MSNGDDTEKLPSIEVKTNYVHLGVVTDMLQKRERAGVLPIVLITTNKISKPAKDKLDSLDIAWAEIPENEIRDKEPKSSEKKE